MPNTFSFDAETLIFGVGEGRIGPVELPVWAYEDSVAKVVKRWFDRRKQNPDGKRKVATRSSRATIDTGAAWMTELRELLNVVGPLVDLGPVQDVPFKRVLACPMLDVAALTAASNGPSAPMRRCPTTESAILLGCYVAEHALREMRGGEPLRPSWRRMGVHRSACRWMVEHDSNSSRRRLRNADRPTSHRHCGRRRRDARLPTLWTSDHGAVSGRADLRVQPTGRMDQ